MTATSIDLTGTWNNLGGDGGTYKILQVGNPGTQGQAVVFWRGQNTNAGWSNVGYGNIDAKLGAVSISWADPDGTNLGNHGQVSFRYVDNNNLTKLAGDGCGNFKRANT
jgi:hypothetical protein